MQKIFFLPLLILITFMLCTQTLYAVALSPTQSTDTTMQAYRKYIDIVPNVQIPTVVEVPIDIENLERQTFAVYDMTTNTYQGSYFKKDIREQITPISASVQGMKSGSAFINSANFMVDDKMQTFTEFPLPDTEEGTISIQLSGANLIAASSLTLLLDQYVALPKTIEIRANVNGEDTIVVANKPLFESTMFFPQTSAKLWTINLAYIQPLRIAELRLNQQKIDTQTKSFLRFLAQSGHTYRIFLDPDRDVYLGAIGEMPYLLADDGVLRINNVSVVSNAFYKLADIDNDGRADIIDNCVRESNPTQDDINRNGRGDACEDFDRDGIFNAKDNCRDLPNATQIDTDNDEIGDVCDNRENRITERLPWIPWVGIGTAVVVLIGLFVMTAKTPNTKGL